MPPIRSFLANMEERLVQANEARPASMSAANPHNIPGLRGYVPPISPESIGRFGGEGTHSNLNELRSSTPIALPNDCRKQSLSKAITPNQSGASPAVCQPGNVAISQRHLRLEKQRTGRILLEVADDVASIGHKAAAEIERMARIYDANYESLKIEYERLRNKVAELEKLNTDLQAQLGRGWAEARRSDAQECTCAHPGHLPPLRLFNETARRGSSLPSDILLEPTPLTRGQSRSTLDQGRALFCREFENERYKLSKEISELKSANFNLLQSAEKADSTLR